MTAFPVFMFFPGVVLIVMCGICGIICDPALATMNGVLVSSSAPFVIIPGVRQVVPSSSVCGISGADTGSFRTSSSASSAGVYSVSSGVAPAAVIPGVVDVSVVAMVHRKIVFPCSFFIICVLFPYCFMFLFMFFFYSPLILSNIIELY